MEVLLGRAPFGTALSACLKLIAPAGLLSSCHFCREAAKSEFGKMSALSRLTSVCKGLAPCSPVLIPSGRLSTGIACAAFRQLNLTTEWASIHVDTFNTDMRRYIWHIT